MTRITDLADALGGLDTATIQRAALERAAAQIEAAALQALSHAPGDDHATPWLRSGALRDSLAHSVEESQAVIGSDSEVAVDQELGTRSVPPRPFLAPAAAGSGEAAAEGIGADFAEALRRTLAGLR